jgi:hypothetical protein
VETSCGVHARAAMEVCSTEYFVTENSDVGLKIYDENNEGIIESFVARGL